MPCCMPATNHLFKHRNNIKKSIRFVSLVCSMSKVLCVLRLHFSLSVSSFHSTHFTCFLRITGGLLNKKLFVVVRYHKQKSVESARGNWNPREGQQPF